MFGIMRHMSPPKPLPEELAVFASLLQAALAKAGLHDARQIGHLVAAAQEDPERDDAPYHPAVVQAWLRGKALPPEPAFMALQDMLADIPSASLEQAYENACLVSPLTPSQEINLTLQARYKAHGLNLDALGHAMAPHGVTYRGNPISKSAVANYFTGLAPIPDHWIPALDAVIPPANGEPSFQSLHHAYFARPSDYLDKAASSEDIHEAFKYMRKACHFNLAQMAEALGEHIPNQKAPSRMTVMNWERPAHDPNNHLPSAAIFSGTDAITAYGEVLTAHGHGAWFAAHEAHLRRSLTNAIHERHAEGKTHGVYAISPASTIAASPHDSDRPRSR